MIPVSLDVLTLGLCKSSWEKGHKAMHDIEEVGMITSAYVLCEPGCGLAEEWKNKLSAFSSLLILRKEDKDETVYTRQVSILAGCMDAGKVRITEQLFPAAQMRIERTVWMKRRNYKWPVTLKFFVLKFWMNFNKVWKSQSMFMP